MILPWKNVLTTKFDSELMLLRNQKKEKPLSIRCVRKVVEGLFVIGVLIFFSLNVKLKTIAGGLCWGTLGNIRIGFFMEEHRGSELEKVIRKKGINISELARKMGVNRRSLYNWFKDKNLKSSIVERMGKAIQSEHQLHLPDNNEADYWRDKYISLLEQHVQILSQDKG